MKRIILAAAALALGLGARAHATVPEKVDPAVAKEKGCMSCHEGIKNIRERTSAMLAQIKGMGSQQGDPEGCVVCHGGNPQRLTAEEAHTGRPAKALKTGPMTFYPDPGSVWIADHSCGQAGCHQGYPYRVERSLMNTEAGKIQGNLHTWGIDEVQNHRVPWGNYAVDDPDGMVPTIGIAEYKKYIAAMHKAHPDQFPTQLDQIPLLKQLAVDNTWKNPSAMVAMSKVVKHNDSLECYACHASWVPQCYGCHVQVNYGPDSDGSLEGMEKVHVQRVLEATHWHRGKACRAPGVSRPRLRRMIRQYGIVPPEGVEDDDGLGKEG